MGKIKINSAKQKIAFLGKEGYVSRAVTYSRIDGQSVLEYASKNSGINPGQLAAAMYAIQQSFENFLMNGHSVELPGVGTFRVAVNSYMVDTKEEVNTDLVYRRKVVYTPSTKIKTILQKSSLTGNNNDDGEVKKFTITVQANNDNMGTVTGGGEYDKDATVTISAQPAAGFVFQCWDDYDNNQDREITVTGNKTYTAIFVEE